jgi:hypothetical protein
MDKKTKKKLKKLEKRDARLWEKHRDIQNKIANILDKEYLDNNRRRGKGITLSDIDERARKFRASMDSLFPTLPNVLGDDMIDE